MHIHVGIDVTKDVHWVSAIDGQARVLIDRAVQNNQPAIEALAAELRRLGPDLVVGLDVTGSIASFLEAVLLAEGLSLVHVPGIAVNRAANGFAGGEQKSDPRDAHVIADLVRTRPGLRPIRPNEETTIAIRLLVARRRDLTQDQTRRVSRMAQLVASIHPGLEGALDLTAKAPLALVSRFVTPGDVRAAGPARLVRHLKKTPGFRQPERHRLGEIDRELEAMVARHPEGALIRSLPGMGAVLSAEFIATAGDISRFRSPDAMAAAAGLAPVLRQSGKARALRRAYGGDKALKRVFYQSAFCAVSTKDPTSKAFYDRKRKEGQRHVQALVALARRRVTVIWAILNHRKPFDPFHRVA